MQEFDIVLATVVSGPAEVQGLEDLLDGRDVYLAGKKTAFIVVDNSGDPAVRAAIGKTGCAVIANATRQRMQGGLYGSISRCMGYALEHYRFRSFLKVDPDSLITGFGLVEALRDYFDGHPRAGLLGSYRFTCTGAPRDFSFWKPVFESDAGRLNRYLDKLKGTDYVPGEHAQGGAMAYSFECLEALRNASLLGDAALKDARIAEDVVFSMLVRYCGFEIHSFVEDGKPFAIAYRGLPLSIAEIRRRGKSVVHSVKFGFMDRWRRRTFRNLRISDSRAKP